MSKYKTESVSLSGAICGAMWTGPKGAISLSVDLQREFKRCSKGASFRDVLMLVLAENGGDFQNASFTADTVVCVERVSRKAGYRTTHVREREIGDLHDCADLVDADSYATDFMEDE